MRYQTLKILKARRSAREKRNKMSKCKDCFCDCHCNVGEHSDANGVCACEKCNCNPQGITVNNDECLSCQ